MTDTFDKYVRKLPNGCWEWTGYCLPAGYGRYRRRAAHRVSFERSKGEIPKGMFVCHSCDNRRCVNPAHLFLGTHADNMRDMVEKGRAYKWIGLRGRENNPRAKLSFDDVLEIRRLRGQASHSQLAARFSVSETAIFFAQTGVTWKP